MVILFRFIPQTPDQQTIWESGFLESHQSGTLILPTGGGKTALARVAILTTLKQGQKAIYLAPTRGVLEEQYRTWQQVISSAQAEGAAADPTGMPKEVQEQQMSLLEPVDSLVSNPTVPDPVGYSVDLESFPTVGQFDSDHPATLGDYQRTDILLMTPERLDLCLRHPGVQKPDHWIRQAGICVIDELQTIGDGHRGARLEGALIRLRWVNPACRWLGLSANLNPQDTTLLDWVGPYRYASTERPVPQVWRMVRYRNWSDRDRVLLDLLGQSDWLTLVFVNSRKGTEALAAKLQCSGIAAAAHHAGLKAEQRQAAEQQFHARQIRVLVATTTLGVGVNLPARQVVVYDLYRPNGRAIAAGARSFEERFVPLTREEVQQLGGRAGRPGLDPQGDVVMLAQRRDDWAESLIPQQEGEKPAAPMVRSVLLSQRAWIVEQVLALVTGGYSRSAGEIQQVLNTGLATAVPNTGLGLAYLEELLDRLIQGRMLEWWTEGDKPALNSTTLGLVCAGQYLMPAVGLRWAYSVEQVLSAEENPTYLDWLALIALAPDWLLGQGSSVNLSRSLWLSQGSAERRLHCQGQPERVQSLYTHAEILRTYTRSGPAQDSVITWAEDQGVRLYAADLQSAVDDAMRLSESLREVVQTLKPPGSVPNSALALVDGKLQVVKQMLATGLDSQLASLTLLSGIGPKRALALKALGLTSLDHMALASPELLIQVKGITPECAVQMIQQAAALKGQIRVEWFRD